MNVGTFVDIMRRAHGMAGEELRENMLECFRNINPIIEQIGILVEDPNERELKRALEVLVEGRPGQDIRELQLMGMDSNPKAIRAFEDFLPQRPSQHMFEAAMAMGLRRVMMPFAILAERAHAAIQLKSNAMGVHL